MKRKKITGFKMLLPVILFLIIAPPATAQKLPNVQESSMHAPANIKADGRATEWDNKFQAYNKSTGIFYTVSNDNNNLYLTIQATDDDIIKKIVLGGVTFTINGSGKAKDQDGVAITYPAYDKKDPSPFQISLSNKIQSEAFMDGLNKQLKERLKTIKVTGVNTFRDSMLSIYNEEGIKAVSLFDSAIQYTYELAVPLKHLGLTDKAAKFNYNIKLNGASSLGKIEIIESSRGLRASYLAENGISYALDGTSQQSMTLVVPTDLWGEYTMAEK